MAATAPQFSAEKANYQPQGYAAQPQGYATQPQGYAAQPPPGYAPPQAPGYAPQAQFTGPYAGGYAQQPGHTNHTVVLQTTPLNSIPLDEQSVRVPCPHCGATVSTTTAYEHGSATWLSAGVCLLLGCWLGCCLIPFCVNASKDVIHTCPNCRQVVGRYHRLPCSKSSNVVMTQPR